MSCIVNSNRPLNLVQILVKKKNVFIHEYAKDIDSSCERTKSQRKITEEI